MDEAGQHYGPMIAPNDPPVSTEGPSIQELMDQANRSEEVNGSNNSLYGV